MRIRVGCLVLAVTFLLAGLPQTWGLFEPPNALPQCAPEVGLTQRSVSPFMNRGQVLAADFNLDGFTDVVGWTNPQTRDFRNDGAGNLVATYTVGPDIVTSYSVLYAVGDLSGDLFPDVVISMYEANRIVWVANIAGTGWGGHQNVAILASPPWGVSVGDLDGDGHLDVIGRGGSSPAWFRNTGSGASWSAQSLISGSANLAPVAVADVSGDGLPDIVYPGSSNTAYVYVNGGGTFGPPISFATGLSFHDNVRSGELSGDGRADIVIASGTTSVVRWWSAGPGGTTFVLEGDLVALPGVRALDLGDLDNDGDLDVVASGGTNNPNVVWVANRGQGVFGPPSFVGDAWDPFHMTLVDMDYDGYLDLMVGINGEIRWWDASAVVVSWPVTSTISLPSGPHYEFALGDFDNNGFLDVAAGSKGAGTLTTHANAGTGPTGTAETVAVTEPSATVACDLDGDGDLDLAVTSENGFLAWLPNNGLGSFGPVTTVLSGLPTSKPSVMACGDFDSDGDADLVYGLEPSVSWIANANGLATVWEPPLFLTSASATRDLEVFDVNGDGHVDVLAAFDSSFGVFLGNGMGLDVVLSVAAASEARGIAAGDLTGNGLVDLVVADHRGVASGVFQVCLASSPGVWDPCTPLSGLWNWPRDVAVGDVNNDGSLDVVGVQYNFSPPPPPGPAVMVYLNVGSGGAFGAPISLLDTNSALEAVKVADLDGDGDDDIVALWQGGSFSVFTSLTRSPAQVYPTTPQTRAWNPLLLPCLASSSSFSCLAANVAATSYCFQDTLLVPPGTYGCLADAHLPVSRPLSLAALLPGSVTLACSGGVGFAVVDDPASPVRASLTLESLTLTGMGAGTSSPRGPGLRVSGAGAVLSLSNVTVEDAATLGPPSDTVVGVGGAAYAGDSGTLVSGPGTVWRRCSASARGGAVALGDGAILQASGTRWEGNSAGEGGAVAAVASAVVNVVDSVFEGNAALGGSGGALVATTPGVLDCRRTSFVRNTALSGLGGGLALRAQGPPEGGPLAAYDGYVEDATFEANEAAVGGAVSLSLVAGESITQALAINDVPVLGVDEAGALTGVPGAPGAAVTRIDFANTTVRSNTARYGGGAYLCGVRLGLAGASTSWSDNVATRSLLRSSAEAFLCAVEGSAASANVSAGTHGLPWLRVGSEVGVERAAFHSGLERVVWAPGSASNVGTEVEAGAHIVAAVGQEDWLGQSVSYTRAVFVVEFPGLSPSIDVTLPGSVFFSEVATPLPSVPLLLKGVPQVVAPSLPVTVDFVVSVPQAPGVGALAASVNVGACGVGSGYVSGSDGVGECSACPGGTTSTTTGLDACVPLPDCPKNSARLSLTPVGNETEVHCLCVLGTWAPGCSPTCPLDVECVACPRGASCAGGSVADQVSVNARPQSLGGFFEVTSGVFEACERPGMCRANSACAPGSEGYMCRVCSPGYYSAPDKRCAACPETASASSLVFAYFLCVVGLAIGAGLMVGQSMGRTALAGEKAAVSFRSRGSMAAPSLILVAFQVVGILSDGSFAWSSSSKSLLGIFNAFNVEASMFATECSFGGWHTEYVVSMVLPLCALVLVLLFLLLVRAAAGSFPPSWPLSGLPAVPFLTLASGAVFVLAPLIYIPTARATLRFLDCSKLPNGVYTLDADPSVECFDGAWWRVAPLGFAGLVVYVIGVPASFAGVLIKSARRLLEPRAILKYGSLYRAFRVRHYYGSVVDMAGRRLGLVVASLFLSRHPLAQIAVLLALLVATALVVVAYKPYFRASVNKLDLALAIVLVGILLLGNASYAERRVQADGAERASSGVLDALALFAVCLLLLVSALGLIFDVRGLCNERRRIGQGRDNTALSGISGSIVASVDEWLPDVLPEDRSVLAKHLQDVLQETQGVEMDNVGFGAMEEVLVEGVGVGGYVRASESESSSDLG